MIDLTAAATAAPKCDVCVDRAGGLVIPFYCANTDAARGLALREAAAAAVSGDAICAGPGRFLLTGTTLHLGDGVNLYGAGQGVTLIVNDDSDAGDGALEGTYVDGLCEIADVTMQATGVAAEPLLVSGTGNLTIHDCTLIGVSASKGCFWLNPNGGTPTATMLNCRCYGQITSYGNLLMRGSYCTNAKASPTLLINAGTNRILGCYFQSDGAGNSNVITVAGASTNTFQANRFQLDGGTGIVVSVPTGVAVRTVALDSNRIIAPSGGKGVVQAGLAATITAVHNHISGSSTIDFQQSAGTLQIGWNRYDTTKVSGTLTPIDTLPIKASLGAATDSLDGYLSAADHTAFNTKVAAARAINTTAPLTGGGNLSADRTLAMPVATNSVDGYLSAADHTTFNAKVGTSRAINTTSPLTGGGDLSADRTLALPAATSSVNGYLTSTDWSTFNAKAPTTDLYWAGVRLTGARYKTLRKVTASTNTYETMTTGSGDSGPTSGKRWLLFATYFYNTNTSTATGKIGVQVSGTDYNFGLVSSSIAQENTSASGHQAAVPYIAEFGDTIRCQATQTGVNVAVSVLEFDSTCGLLTARLLAPASGDNVLYTAPASTSAVMLDENLQTSYSFGSSGSAAGVRFGGLHYVNGSGGARAVTAHVVPSGQAVGTAYKVFNAASIADGTRQVIPVAFTLETGDFVNVNTNAATATQFVWASFALKAY